MKEEDEEDDDSESDDDDDVQITIGEIKTDTPYNRQQSYTRMPIVPGGMLSTIITLSLDTSVPLVKFYYVAL